MCISQKWLRQTLLVALFACLISCSSSSRLQVDQTGPNSDNSLSPFDLGADGNLLEDFAGQGGTIDPGPLQEAMEDLGELPPGSRIPGNIDLEEMDFEATLDPNGNGGAAIDDPRFFPPEVGLLAISSAPVKKQIIRVNETGDVDLSIANFGRTAVALLTLESNSRVADFRFVGTTCPSLLPPMLPCDIRLQVTPRERGDLRIHIRISYLTIDGKLQRSYREILIQTHQPVKITEGENMLYPYQSEGPNLFETVGERGVVIGYANGNSGIWGLVSGTTDVKIIENGNFEVRESCLNDEVAIGMSSRNRLRCAKLAAGFQQVNRTTYTGPWQRYTVEKCPANTLLVSFTLSSGNNPKTYECAGIE